MWRKIIALTLVFVLFWGNTGFSVNLHYCSSEQALYFTFYDVWGNRCNKQINKSDGQSCEKGSSSSCCELMASKLPSPAKEDCCSDQKITVKINDTYHQAPRQGSPVAPCVEVFSSLFYFDLPVLTEVFSTFSEEAFISGIPISCGNYLVLISVFRI
jgi:hypothetical protein